MSLHNFLKRLIWLCVLPLLLLAAYLAIDRVLTTRSQRDLEAANLAKNVATAIDQQLNARIGALHMLAVSPLANEASRWEDLYQEAQGFRQSFGSHVILADLEMRMLFNTRVPFGTALPMLPRSRGRSAAPIAIETAMPAVGDVVFGPIAKEPLVAIAVPGLREGKTAFLLLTIFETRQFQERLEQVALPSGWSLALLDGNGEAIARRAPPELNSATEVDAAGRFVVKSALSPWSVVLEIPRDSYRAPMVAAAAALAITILAITLASALGGTFASRRLGRAVASLAEMPASGAPPPEITEIAAVRRLLDEAATKRATAEAALHEINASLEQRVEVRTAQLTAANRELEAFSYSVSHDLRGPLRSMDGFSLALLEDYGDKLDDEGRDALERIRAASQRMGELIDDLLRLSQVTRAELKLTPVDISAIAREIAEALDRAQPDRPVKWAIESGLNVRADPALMRIAMQNLLHNAWKFTGRTDRPVIRVGALERDARKVYFVADNGVGFDISYADKLFGAFQRLHHAGDFPGTGIGLAIVQRIIRRHDGEIRAEAKEGEGATFFFSVKESEHGSDEQDHPAG